MKKGTSGFTIVELLIVIVVIAILASISVVAYQGIQKRAREAVLQTDLRQAMTSLEIAKAKDGVYPSSAEDLSFSSGVGHDYRLEGGEYCLTVRVDGNAAVSPYHISSGSGIASGPCLGHSYAGPAPAGVNLAAPLSEWYLEGGAVYDAVNQEIVFNSHGSAWSPYTRVDGPSGWQFSVEINSPPRPGGSTGDRLYNTHYRDIDNQSFTVPGGWTGNGSADSLTANTWERSVFQGLPSMTAPGLAYIQFGVNVTSSYGVAGSRIRSPEIIITR